MGLFTTVIHPETGEHLQFKTGHDRCDEYRVGDPVDFRVLPEAGEAHLADDAYFAQGVAGPDRRYYVVIVKDHKVHAVVDPLPDPQAEGEILGFESQQEAYFRVAYGLKPLPLDAWSDEAWAARAKKDARHARELERQKGEDLLLTKDEWDTRRGANAFTRRMMREPGFLRKIFAMDPPPPPEPRVTAFIPKDSPLPGLPGVETSRVEDPGWSVLMCAMRDPRRPCAYVVDGLGVPGRVGMELRRLSPGGHYLPFVTPTAEVYAQAVGVFLRSLPPEEE